MNRLSQETSPYLLQHAHNPVDWFPWSKEALDKAKNEDKPILVSIGYSACHWCHVMERESFEHHQIAEIMNQYFVCIKVDREERPDVDAVYMDSLHAMGVRGGWPLNVFLMPDAKPFYGGTYFPPQNWANLLMSIQNAFIENREKLQESANGFAENLQLRESEKYAFGEGHGAWSLDDLKTVYRNLSKDFDTKKGGMKRSPKFPMPAIWLFLLRYYQQTKDESAFNQLILTLNRIAFGGIYDTVGGGWTRYSTDEDWKVPHFEKMLYDNGQLVSLYAEAFCLTKDEFYKQKVEETIDWLEKEMSSPEGGFYSALDADSEGEEGKYYIWKIEEIREVLGEKAEEFIDFFEFTDDGNWEHGNNIVHLDIKKPFTESIKNSISQLKKHRNSRIRPGLDNKILCSWNGLMLKGLVDAFKYIGNENFLELALKNANFIKQNLSISVKNEDEKEARGLFHQAIAAQNRHYGEAFLEDYAAVIDAYISLYQVCFDEDWLREAEMIIEYTIANFYDTEDEFFYFTDSQGEELIARKKEIFDNVIPASNSIMAHNLYRLGLILERNDFLEISNTMLAKMKPIILNDPQWVMNWASLATYHAKPTAEVAIIGNNLLKFRELFDEDFTPNKILIGTETQSDLPLLQNRTAINSETTIYVCFDKTCQLPTSDIEKAIEMVVGN